MNNEIQRYQEIINRFIDKFKAEEKSILMEEVIYQVQTEPLPIESNKDKFPFTTGDDYVLRMIPTTPNALNFLATKRDRIYKVLQKLCADTLIKWMLVTVRRGALVGASFTHLPSGDKKDFAITLINPDEKNLLKIAQS